MFMNIIYRVAICVGILLVTKVHSEGSCQLKKPNGTFLTDKEWKFGMTLADIRDDSLAVEILSYEAIDIDEIESIVSNTDSNRIYATAELKNENDKKILKVKLTDDFKHYEEDEAEEELKIKIICKCSSDKRSLEIYQPIIDVNNHNPEFLNIPYEYIMQMPVQKYFKIDSKKKIAARDIDITNKNITFSLDSKDGKTNGFSISWLAKDKNDKKKHFATLLTTDVIDLEDDVTFHIFAEDIGKPPIKTNTTVTIKVDNINSGPKFSQSLYTADCKNIQIQEAKRIPIIFDNEIVVVRGAEPNMTISVISNPKGYENYFKLSISADFSKINFELDNPPKELLNEKFVILSLKVMKVRSSTTAILHIELPGLLDEASAAQLSFGETLYTFAKDNRFTGTLMKETATIESGNGTIVYSGEFQDEELQKKISINSTSSEVTVTEILDPGIYVFKIEAKVKSLTLSTKTTVLLTIASTEMEFEYALRIVEVEEEAPNTKILSLGDQSCTYVIQSQTPSQDWFHMTDNFLSSRKIDRESPFFSNMSIAQVRLVVEACCTGKPFVHQERAKRETKYNVILEDIPFNRSKMHIVAIITDINDNPPMWDTKISKVIGYPTKELSKFIVLPRVYRLSATDADTGENAIISYRLKDASTFYIHPKEGTLYIRQGVQIANNVKAVAFDGIHQSTLELSIQLLEIQNIVALYVRNAVIEDAENILSKMQDNVSNFSLRSIAAAVISDSVAIMSSPVSKIANKDSVEAKTLLRILMYGLNVNSNSALDSAQLRSVLESSGGSSAWHVSKISCLDEIITSQSNDGTNTSYMVATIILSLVIAAAIVAFVVFMVRYRRTTMFL